MRYFDHIFTNKEHASKYPHINFSRYDKSLWFDAISILKSISLLFGEV